MNALLTLVVKFTFWDGSELFLNLQTVLAMDSVCAIAC